MPTAFCPVTAKFRRFNLPAATDLGARSVIRKAQSLWDKTDLPTYRSLLYSLGDCARRANGAASFTKA